MLSVLGLSGATKRVAITRLLALKNVSLLLLLAMGMLAAVGVHAQTITTVTGTIIDPQGLAYANGTITPIIVGPGTGVSLTVTTTGGPVFNPGSVATNGSGAFSMNLIANGSISPASSTYSFVVCAPALISQTDITTLNGNGICFTVTGVTIAGASQDISATLNASANPLARNWNAGKLYSTNPAAGTSSISAQTMLASVPAIPATGTRYTFTTYISQTVLGSSCAGNSTIVVNVIFQDPNAASGQTTAIATYTVTTNGTLGIVPLTANNYGGAITFVAKPGTAIQYSTTYTPGGSCSPAPAVQVFPVLELD
jgi:hypothetical protein